VRRDRQLRREVFFDEAASLTPYLAFKTRHGDLFFISSDDKVLGKLLFVRGRNTDAKVLSKAVCLLDEDGFKVAGSTFVDVGANIGTTTVVALRHHGFSRGVSIEASPSNVRTLRINLTANELDDAVTVIAAAVSDDEGEQVLILSGKSSGEHTLDPTKLSSEPSGHVTVKTVTLDGLVSRREIDPTQVGLLWVDVAGTETIALAGASTLIEAGVPIVVAVRPKNPESWLESKAVLAGLLRSYTDFALLRKGSGGWSKDVMSLLDQLSLGSDLLAVRR